MAISTLKMYYDYGMVIMLVKNSGLVKEKGTHQNHVLDIIITKLNQFKDCENFAIENKKSFFNKACSFLRDAGEIFLQ